MAIQYKVDLLAALKAAGYSSYRLRKEKLLGEATIQRIRQGEPVSWENVSTICKLWLASPVIFWNMFQISKTNKSKARRGFRSPRRALLRFAPPGGMLPSLLFGQPLHLHAAGHQFAGQTEIAVVVLAVHAGCICCGGDVRPVYSRAVGAMWRMNS